MQAFRCLGQIFSAEGDDDETALSPFHVALDGFTFMDVHRWRADCMVRIADILNSHGEVMKAVGLWKSARPLFKRSSQMKDVTKLDEKLAEVDSAVLVEYEEKPQHLSELHVPGSTPDEKYVIEDEEEEENKPAQTSDFRDKGGKEFWFDLQSGSLIVRIMRDMSFPGHSILSTNLVTPTAAVDHGNKSQSGSKALSEDGFCVFLQYILATQSIQAHHGSVVTDPV
ncbi:hypothetical protein C8J57DRAFT_1252836 [Mycena rebaudengoi]|nr:hypothetical protein C8J57DRAFT_1252836 [Mycena rebaudengoi]